jgi:hypothetical protein
MCVMSVIVSCVIKDSGYVKIVLNIYNIIILYILRAKIEV